MPLTENEIEKLLFDSKGMYLKDETYVSFIHRQHPINGYFIDLFGVDENAECAYVIEIKKDEVSGKALAQVLNYMDIVRRYLDRAGNKDMGVKGILIGSHLSDHMELAVGAVNNVDFYKYKLPIDTQYESWNFSEDAFDKDNIKKQVDLLSQDIEEFKQNNGLEAESDGDDE